MAAEIPAPVLSFAGDDGSTSSRAASGHSQTPLMEEQAERPALEGALEGTNYLYHVELWTEPPSPPAPTTEQMADRLAELAMKRRTPEGRAELEIAICEQAASQIIDHMQALPLTKSQLHDLMEEVYVRCQSGAHRVVFTLERLYIDDDKEPLSEG